MDDKNVVTEIVCYDQQLERDYFLRSVELPRRVKAIERNLDAWVRPAIVCVFHVCVATTKPEVDQTWMRPKPQDLANPNTATVSYARRRVSRSFTL